MYHFVVIALLGLALFKLVDLLEEAAPTVTRWHAVLTIGLGIVAAFAIDYSVFDGYGVAFREDWMGTFATGLVIGGMTSVWRAAFHWLGSSEGDAPEARHPQHGPRSMAA